MGAIIGFIAGVLFVAGMLMILLGIMCVHDELKLSKNDGPFDKRSIILLISGIVVVLVAISVLFNGVGHKSEEEACALAGRQWMSQSCIEIQ